MSEELRELLREMAPYLSGLEKAALFAAKVLGDAEAKEVTGKEAVALARVEYEKMKANVLTKATEDGLIDRSNASLAKRQSEVIIAGDGALRVQDEYVKNIELAAALNAVDVTYYQNVFKVFIEAVRREVRYADAG